jgi:Zn-dependent protease with chaperone function
MAGSTWWPTPANPSKWFSADQLENSRAYYEPWDSMKRVVAATVLGFSLALAWWANSTSLGIWVYPLAVLCLQVPLAAYFWWFYARHAPAFGVDNSPKAAMLLGALRLAGSTALISGGTLALLRTFESAASGLLAVLLASAALGWLVLRGPWIDDPDRVMASEDQTAFLALADWVGVKCSFVLENPLLVDGPNARAERGRREDFVVVNPALLEESAEFQSLVVAHEVCHLKRGHHRKMQWLALARAMLWVLGMWIVFGLTSSSFEASENFPLWLLASVLLFVPPALGMKFVARHFERQADADSYELLGSVPSSLARELYARRLSELDPGLLSRTFSAHPPPAERLEVTSRRIQTI